ncbi:glycosyltransferase 87 family protein [Sphingomonas sp. M1-B02]|uniref:glycosyltransferase 87 family protein n=1 Tax=Sphingomonas sp. M1-B02 TaxID=3114300 RepID=UPI002240B12C|nr:glycosyltransferase 87 family protein [Sphingomonas sp. S6-11]UZK65483.1 glycosyltransferase 87 family protein [Sphingomonas sp. S6-11]
MGWAQSRDWNWRTLSLALALAVTCAAGWLFKAHCVPGGWTDAEQYTTGCYNDVMPFWLGREVQAGKLPYFETRMEYPVLTGAQIWAEGAVTRTLFGSRARDWHFLAVVTVANALLAGLILWMFVRAGVDRRRLWLWALAPPLVLYLGHNWDLAAVAFAVGAMLLARNGRLVPAAAMAGLGAAAKLFPVLALPLIGLSALFGDDRPWPRRLLRAAALSAAAIGAWSLVNLPVALLAPENWNEFYRFSQERQGTVAATWDILANQGWWFTWIEDRNRYAALLFLGGFAAIIGFGWRRHRTHLWILFIPALAWFMLTNKVYSPQFDLWLYPLLLMAAPRLWPVALYLVGAVTAFFAEFWWFAGLEHAWPATTHVHIAIAAGVRGFAMLWLIADCVRLDPPEWVADLANTPSPASENRAT